MGSPVIAGTWSSIRNQLAAGHVGAVERWLGRVLEQTSGQDDRSQARIMRGETLHQTRAQEAAQ
jgi:hypothetical protein